MEPAREAISKGVESSKSVRTGVVACPPAGRWACIWVRMLPRRVMALVRAGSGGLAAMLDRRRARRKDRCSRGLMVEGAEGHVRKVKAQEVIDITVGRGSVVEEESVTIVGLET